MVGSFDALDRAMSKLQRPNKVEDRLAALSTLVEYWHGPIRLDDGIPETELAGHSLPEPLRWWYRWAGRRTEIMSGQNQLFLPVNPKHTCRQLETLDDKLLFYLENQACYFWSTSTMGEDPPVFGRESERDPWREEAVSLSEHLVLACMLEVVLAAPFGAGSCDLGEDKFAIITASVPEIAIGPWRWCNFRFYSGSGCMMVANLLGQIAGLSFFDVLIGAREKEALGFLKPLLGPEWEYARID